MTLLDGTLPLYGLPIQANTIRVRSTEIDSATGNLLEGDWEDLPVTVTAPPNDPPSLFNLEFEQTTVAYGLGSGTLTGTLTDGGANHGGTYTVEVDIDGDGYVDTSTGVYSPTSAFTIPLTNLPIGNAEIALRASEIESATGDEVSSAWQLFTVTVVKHRPVRTSRMF